MVTHDQEEALSISDTVAVMHAGRILQVGSPRELYECPSSRFVATFLGDANLIPGEFVGRAAGTEVLIRPERVALGGPFSGRITALCFRGPDLVADVQTPHFSITLRSRSDAALALGDEIRFDLPAASLWALPDGGP